VPASVKTSVPASNTNIAKAPRAAGFAPAAFQCRRPAIIRCRTRKRSPSSAMTMRLPRRSMPTTCAPNTLESGGSAVRSRKGCSSFTACSRAPLSFAVRLST
jgi:hypothetical protein